jgi:hypothetical protein
MVVQELFALFWQLVVDNEQHENEALLHMDLHMANHPLVVDETKARYQEIEVFAYLVFVEIDLVGKSDMMEYLDRFLVVLKLVMLV